MNEYFGGSSWNFSQFTNQCIAFHMEFHSFKVCFLSLRLLCSSLFSSIGVSLFLSEMGKLSSVFSMRHFLVLSLALNVCLISRVVYEGENWREEEQSRALMADASQKSAHVSRSSPTPPSPSTVTSPEIKDDGERVINLDQ